jgi:NADH dehydrogenase (ubiquinone) 1 alpha subcomplex subunit 13
MNAPTQDLPPKGGFDTIRFQRNMPKRGPTGFVFLTGLTALMGYGWYWNVQTIKERKYVCKRFLYNPTFKR